MAWGEGNLQTARLNTSIRHIIKTLGVRFKRKTPAQIEVVFTRGPQPDLNTTQAARAKKDLLLELTINSLATTDSSLILKILSFLILLERQVVNKQYLQLLSMKAN